MSSDAGVIRTISWRDALPWLILLRVFRLSISPSVLFLAAVGIVLTPLGWIFAAKLISPETEGRHTSFGIMVRDRGELPGLPSRASSMVSLPRLLRQEAPATSLAPVRGDGSLPPSLFATFYDYVDPYVQLFRHGLTLRQFGYLLAGCVWTLCVWSIAAGAITRIAAVTLGREERMPFFDAVKHAVRKFRSFVAAPLIPLGVVLLLCLPAILLGFLMQWDGAVIVAGLLWIVVIVCSFLGMLLLVGLFFGWPLMVAAISGENSDAFDALSRSYAYTYQRPLHYLFYAVVAAILGLFGWVVVLVFSEGLIDLSWWAAAWGAGVERVAELRTDIAPVVSPVAETEQGAVYWVGMGVVAMLERLVRTLASAYGFAFFWCAMTAIYLLLRRDVDRTEFDEVVLDENDIVSHRLPPLEPPPDVQGETAS